MLFMMTMMTLMISVGISHARRMFTVLTRQRRRLQRRFLIGRLRTRTSRTVRLALVLCGRRQERVTRTGGAVPAEVLQQRALGQVEVFAAWVNQLRLQ